MITEIRQKVPLTISIMMFLEYSVWGAWYVTLGSYLNHLNFKGTEIGLIYGTFAIAAMISPIIVGAVSDRLFAAQKVLGVLHIIGAALLIFITTQTSFRFVYTLILLYALSYMPTIALTNGIAMSHLKNPKNEFPKARVLGTIGWIMIGWIVSYLEIETSYFPILIASCLSVLLGLFSFSLPNTPPKKVGEKLNVNQLLGLDAIKLMRNKSFAVLIIVSLFISIPLSFYYSFANLFLHDTGMSYVAAKMTLGQISEIGFMFLLPLFFRKYGIKKILLIAIFAWALRYICFAFGMVDIALLLYVGILLHGICYDFFFVAGQIYVDEEAPKELKNSAQGLLTQATYGIGMFIGTWVSGVVANYYTLDKVYEWNKIWLVPVGIAIAVAIVFLFSFKEKISKPQKLTKL